MAANLDLKDKFVEDEVSVAGYLNSNHDDCGLSLVLEAVRLSTVMMGFLGLIRFLWPPGWQASCLLWEKHVERDGYAFGLKQNSLLCSSARYVQCECHTQTTHAQRSTNLSSHF